MVERIEKLKKMSRIEIEANSKIAADLYDKFQPDTIDHILPKEAFILGYLHGIEKAYDEIGMYDDPDDLSKAYDFLDKNIDRFQK